MGSAFCSNHGHTRRSYLLPSLIPPRFREAKVSSCYTCVSQDSACKKGSTSLTKMQCVPGLDEGCMAMTVGALGKEAWTRSCCGSTDPTGLLSCETKHTKT